MKKVNFNVPLLDLSGKPVRKGSGEEIRLNEELANIIVVREAKDNALQMLELAIKLNSAPGAIELADSECELINDTVQNSKITVLLAAQIRKVLNNAIQITESKNNKK